MENVEVPNSLSSCDNYYPDSPCNTHHFMGSSVSHDVAQQNGKYEIKRWTHSWASAGTFDSSWEVIEAADGAPSIGTSSLDACSNKYSHQVDTDHETYSVAMEQKC